MHDPNTCQRLTTEKPFAGESTARAWITRQGGGVHAIRPSESLNGHAPGVIVEFCGKVRAHEQ